MLFSGFFQPLRVGNRVSLGLLLLRVVVGLAFMHHGYSKIQNPFGWMGDQSATPGFLQALAALSEFGGGAAWVAGLLTPLASFGIACTMFEATRLQAFILKNPFVPSGPGGSYELSAVFFCVAVLLFLTGPGKFSIDRVLFGEKG